jgi:DNA repair protein RadC
MSEPSISAARGILANADRLLVQLENQLEHVKAANDRATQEAAGHAAEKAAHQKALSDLTAKQVAEHEARRREISNRESALVVAQREVQAERQRIAARERDVERRAADLGNRLRGVA